MSPILRLNRITRLGLTTALLMALPNAASAAGERALQRLAERHAEALAFPALVDRCAALDAGTKVEWAEALQQWQSRRAETLAEAAQLIDRLATSQGQTREAVDAAIREQADARNAAADVETLRYTCKQLHFTLRGEPVVPVLGAQIDEDTRREILDELLPVASKLMPCEQPERILVRGAPPAVLRFDATSVSALADRVEMWNVIGCGRSLDVELSLRFPDGDPPTFALGFPRTATPATVEN